MGCLPSKSAARNHAEPEMQSRKVPTTSTQKPRPSSAEHLTAPLTPATTVAPETPMTPNHSVPLPKRPDCIAPRPQKSDDSLKRHHVDHANDHGHGQAAAVGLAGGVAAGAAVIGGDSALGGGVDAGGGGGGGGDAGGGDGGGGGGGD